MSQHCSRLQRIWQARTGDRMLSEDIAQETALVVLRRLKGQGVDDPDKLANFIYGTAINVHRNMQRKHARLSMDDEMVARATDPAGGPEDEALRDERRQSARETIENLPVSRDRDVLRRVLVYQQRKDEICDATALNTQHYDRVAYRARRRAAALQESAAGTTSRDRPNRTHAETASGNTATGFAKSSSKSGESPDT